MEERAKKPADRVKNLKELREELDNLFMGGMTVWDREEVTKRLGKDLYGIR
jgi:hypothetical protein